eukprot:gene3480-2431_t
MLFMHLTVLARVSKCRTETVCGCIVMPCIYRLDTSLYGGCNLFGVLWSFETILSFIADLSLFALTLVFWLARSLCSAVYAGKVVYGGFRLMDASVLGIDFTLYLWLVVLCVLDDAVFAEVLIEACVFFWMVGFMCDLCCGDCVHLVLDLCGFVGLYGDFINSSAGLCGIAFADLNLCYSVSQ